MGTQITMSMKLTVHHTCITVGCHVNKGGRLLRRSNPAYRSLYGHLQNKFLVSGLTTCSLCRNVAARCRSTQNPCDDNMSEPARQRFFLVKKGSV
jgi:hypothetical protein